MKAMDLNLLSSVKSLTEDAPLHLVAQCCHYKQAVQLCMDLSRVKRSRQAWAELLGMTAGTLSMILNGSNQRKSNLDPDLFPVIEDLAGNRVITQFFELQSKRMLNSQNPKLARINELKAELEKLEAAQ